MKCPYCNKEITDTTQVCRLCWKNIPQDVLKKTKIRSTMALSYDELSTAYHSSVVLRRIGMFFYIIPFIFFIFLAPTNILLSLILYAFYMFMLYPIAYLLRNVRLLKSQKRLIHIAVFTKICGGISIVVLLGRMLTVDYIENAYQLGNIAGSILLIIIYSIIWLYVHRHVKTSVIFSDKPYSHSDLKSDIESRKHLAFYSHSELQRVIENRMALLESTNISYPEKNTYGKLAKTAMFFSPLAYLFTIGLSISVIEESFSVVKSKQITEISQEKIKYAEECVQQGDEAAEAKDFQKAFDYYEKAADLGHPLARLNLGIFHAEGLTGTADWDKAFNLLSSEDIIVSPVAKYYVGLFFYMGKGTTQDFKKAADYLLASADAGYEPAQKWLGYENGKKPNMTRPLEEMLEDHWKNSQK